MIATKIYFRKFRHAYRLTKSYKANKFLYLLKKCYPEVLLDQDDCRVNFAVSVNLTKNLLVNFRFKSEAIKFFVLLGFLVKFNKSRAIIASSIVASS